jgi:glyoxylase-like metal-dependent hydrolase (beta-lactamase superfamily II)
LTSKGLIRHLFQDVDYAWFDMFLEYLRAIPKPTTFITDGMMIGDWRLLHTPGHTPGHTVLVRGDVAITGDLVLQEETSNVAYMPLNGYHPLSEYLRSLVKIARLQVGVIIPSHGPLIYDCSKRVVEIFNHHYNRLEQTSQALQQGLTKPNEIAGEIKWSKGEYNDLSPFDKWLALLETLSHLDFLAEVGYAATLGPGKYKLANNAQLERIETRLVNIADGLWVPRNKTPHR